MKIVENVKQIKNTNTNVKEIRNKDTVLWPSFDDIIGAPGNRKLLAGNMQAGWFGEVPARALKSVEYFEKIPHSNSLDYAGWRPCLKLIG